MHARKLAHRGEFPQRGRDRDQASARISGEDTKLPREGGRALPLGAAGQAVRRAASMGRFEAALVPISIRAAVGTDQTVRSTIIFLISAIALAGFRPLGQVLAQFMIVWQR